MTDSMKFGPEWLRNMGQDGCTAPTPTPRYQLAEHRYGREEMLALFDRVVKAPDPLASLPGLYVDKTQIPLALIQMTEEETRHWNRGINSDAVLRAVGKTPPLPLNPSVRGSRGAPILSVGLSERGRGRGRGGFTTYSRGLSYEESGDIPSGPPHGHLGAPPGGYTRGTRPFDRPQQGERSWGERNGLDSTDWSSTSPRKDFNERDRGLGLTASTRSFSNTDSNWRRHRSEDEDGWRTLGTPVKEKWCGAGASGAARTTSWREGDRDREKDGDRDLLEGRGSYTRPHRSWDHSNNLPEWAVDGADNSGGSFDAQGAFHGGQNYSDDEEGGMVNNNALRRTRLLSEGNSVGSPVKKEGNINLHVRRVVATDRASAERVSEKLTPYLDKQNDRVPSPFSPPRNEEPKSQDSTPVKSVPNSKSDPALKPKEFTSPSPSRIVLVKNEPELSQKQLEHPNALATSASMPAMPINAAVENSIDTRQKQVIHEHKSEDAMERMREVADDLVAKLMEEEERPMREDITHRPLPHLGSHAREPEKWFYRDPQGQVQGPFSSEEMAEWWRLGYFTLNLLVRRAKDERFSPLQDLIKIFGDIPFLTDSNVPPVKGTEPLLMPTPGVGLPIGSTLPKLPMSGLPGMPGLPGVPGVPVVPGVEPDIQIMMQHQFQVMQQQMFLRQQQSQAAAAAAAVSKLSQTEGWATLSPMEQQQLVGQHIQMNAHLVMDGVPPLLPSASAPNPVVALMSQYQQKPQQQSCAPSNNDASGQKPGQSLDPLQQLIQQMGGLSSRLSPPLASPQPSQSANDPLPSDPIQSLLRQLGQQQQHQQHHQSMDDSLWGNRHYTSIGWLGGVRPPLVGGSVPPSGPMLPPSTASLWGDLNAKEMKTEKQILVEQMRLEEERKKQELLQKQEEEEQQRRLEEEARQRREAEEAAAEAEKRRKKAEESRRKEEESKRKEDQRKAEEEQRKKLEEAKRQEIAKKKDEDKRRKEDEKKKKEEDKERKKREEEEKKRLEEERHQRQREAEEQAKRAEQQRQQAEALKKMQEQQQKQAQAAAVIKTAKIAPWSQPQAVKASGQSASLSLAEIQRNQKREKEEQLREQQMILQQIQQQNQQNQLSAMLASSLAAAENQAQPAPMQLKWAERKPAPLPEAKTLEQIQREEHERVAKQMERDRAERAERAASARDAPAPSVGIWGSAPQSLTWGSGPGFWDEVASPVVSPVKPSAQTLKKNTPVKSASASNVSAAAQQSSKTTNSSAKKKKEEATVLKLFEQTVQRTDEFSQWCHKALASLQPSVDIPTFVGFLRDIESPYEVKDYVRQYLGEGEGANDFARQFLERRSKWRSERRSKPAADDMCAPAPAVNPATQPTSHDFQEVKSKGKKAKKGKMYKVDKSILGFSVTAAPDRINVGDRDYGEGM